MRRLPIPTPRASPRRSGHRSAAAQSTAHASLCPIPTPPNGSATLGPSWPEHYDYNGHRRSYGNVRARLWVAEAQARAGAVRCSVQWRRPRDSHADTALYLFHAARREERVHNVMLARRGSDEATLVFEPMHGAGESAWSQWPSWRGNARPPRAPQTAAEGVRLPSAPVRSGPAAPVPPRGRRLSARGRPRCRFDCV